MTVGDCHIPERILTFIHSSFPIPVHLIETTKKQNTNRPTLATVTCTFQLLRLHRPESSGSASSADATKKGSGRLLLCLRLPDESATNKKVARVPHRHTNVLKIVTWLPQHGTFPPSCNIRHLQLHGPVVTVNKKRKNSITSS